MALKQVPSTSVFPWQWFTNALYSSLIPGMDMDPFQRGHSNSSKQKLMVYASVYRNKWQQVEKRLI